MISKGLFIEHFPLALNTEGNIEEILSELLKMIDYTENFNTNYFVCENSLYSKSVLNTPFADWLYGLSQPELNDVKRELIIKISKSQTLSPDIDITQFIKDESVFIVGNTEAVFIWNIFNYLNFKQIRLKNITSKTEFSQEIQECYYNIFFDKDISYSLNTLNNNFASIRDEIIVHLQRLDEFYETNKCCNNIGFSNLDFSSKFKEFSKIDCSPQASRDSTVPLKKRYLNKTTNKEEEITCELHTKFSTHDRDSTKQDRIYFHKGKIGVCDNKLIVIHIGKHM